MEIGGIMDINIDTRKMKFKKDDILIYDGDRFTVISKKDLLAPLYKEIKLLRQDIEIEQNKRKKFVKHFKGVKQ